MAKAAPLNVDDFVFDLPEELIAAYPAERRDQSRLLVVPKDPARPFEHRVFSDIVEYLRPNDVLVMNNSRVIPARLFAARSGGGRTELLLLQEEAQSTAEAPVWRALARPGRKVRPGDQLTIAPERFEAEVLAAHESGERTLRFHCEEDFRALLDEFGHTPLPPYILRRRQEETHCAPEELDVPEDRERYQTVYAQPEGSVAAPTAGLHFTPELLDRVRAMGVETAWVTLHVGAGTFASMEPGGRVENHKMHIEEYEVSPETAALLNRAKQQGRRIIAVGTTAVRTLESAADAETGELRAERRSTGLMIAPGYRFRMVDAMVTNFHLPRSTLLLLVSAFCGRERILAAYREAIERRYRFFSYGDAMLLGA